jgi:ferredoxin
MKHVVIIFIAMVSLLTAWALYAQTKTGEDIQLTSYSGTYMHENAKHYLVTEDAKLILLLAPPAALDSLGIKLKDGDELSITAALQKGAYLVSTIQHGEQLIRLRSDDLTTNNYSHMASVMVTPSKCIACKLCISPCPMGAIRMEKGKAYIDPAKCVSCGICMDGNGKFRGCPVRAISN